MRSAANSMHCRSTQDIASPDEEWVEGVHAATQAAQEDLLISNTRLIGSGQGAYDASRMSTVRQLRMLVSLKVMSHHRSARCMQHMQLRILPQPSSMAASHCQRRMLARMTFRTSSGSNSPQQATGVLLVTRACGTVSTQQLHMRSTDAYGRGAACHKAV